MKRIPMSALFLALSLSLGAAAQTPPAPPPAPVQVAGATQVEGSALLWVPGTVISREDARIASEASGRVTFVAEVGTRIDAGAVLARTDTTLLELRLREHDADIARTQAQLDYQRKQVDRLTQLEKSSSIAGNQLDEASSQLAILEQERAQARIAREQTAHALKVSEVRAPFSGVVAERFVQPGEFLSAGSAVARVVSLEHVELQVQAPIGIAARLAQGESVAVRSGNSQSAQAIRAVVPVGDAQSRQFELRVALDEGDWRIGDAVQVGIPSSEQRQAVVVPRDALVLRKNEIFVFRIKDGTTAERVTVTTGAAFGDLIEIEGGIEVGDSLVIRGAERLSDGQTVEVRS